jgi:outer membrane protein assembly factor BamB
VAVLLCCSIWSGRVLGSLVFAPAENSPDAATELKTIARELGEKNHAGAARRVDGLLGARAEQLANVTENSLTSITAWMDQLSPEARKLLAGEYAKESGPAARQALESISNGHVPKPQELYAVARRYPMTAAAQSALVQAGDGALQLGDFAAAQAFYELGLHEGAALGEGRAKKLEMLKKIAGGETLAAPADLEDPIAGEHAKPRVRERRPFAGTVPFDAPWFGHATLMGQAKFFPSAFDDRLLISSWKGVCMLGENGQVIWKWVNPTAPGNFAVERGAGARGAVFGPAVLADVFGKPAVVVVRQLGRSGDSRYSLHGLRAADGKALWSTPAEGQNAFTYAGLPAISGGYVYCMGVQKTSVSSGNLLLCALDINTGETLWQAALGTISEQGDLRQGGKFARGQPLNFESVAELSEPAISGDLVLLSPNCGSLIAVGRFDGRIRWVYTYRETDAAKGEKANRWMGHGEGEKSLQVRYRCTPVVCGEMVLTMPQDAPAVFGVERSSGKMLWETDLYGGYALAGASGNIAVICGDSLSGIDVVKKRLIWKYEPPRGGSLSGPAVVQGQTVIAPTTSGFIQLNVSDGKEKAVYDVPSVRKAVATEAGKAAMNEMGIPRAFGTAGGR